MGRIWSWAFGAVDERGVGFAYTWGASVAEHLITEACPVSRQGRRRRALRWGGPSRLSGASPLVLVVAAHLLRVCLRKCCIPNKSAKIYSASFMINVLLCIINFRAIEIMQTFGDFLIAFLPIMKREWFRLHVPISFLFGILLCKYPYTNSMRLIDIDALKHFFLKNIARGDSFVA